MAIRHNKKTRILAGLLLLTRVDNLLWSQIPYALARHETPEYKAWAIVHDCMNKLAKELGASSYTDARYLLTVFKS